MSLIKKLESYLYDDDSALDREIEHSLGEPSERMQREISPETFARREQQVDDLRSALLEEEHEQYLRMHQWSVTMGAKWLKRLYRAMAECMLAVMGVFLLQTVVTLPPFGAADNPYNNEVSQRYIEQGIPETGAINFVAGMILDYRAFDTFGESTVLFVAASSVLLLLKNDEILQLAAKILVPIILLYGIYVVLNGHLSPGGGFSGGAVMGAALILYLNAFGFEKTGRFFTFKLFRWATFLPLMTYAGLKSYSFFTGANHIDSGIPLGTPGAILSSGLILPLNICVGLIVMCTMYAFYTLFRKGGM